MLFNTLPFFLFLPIVFVGYWFLFGRNLRGQNVFLLAASYFFYAQWDWRFLFLLLFSTALDFSTGWKIANSTSQRNKKTWLWVSIIINLGFLGVFKYYNFFIGSLTQLFEKAGLHVNIWTFKILLPVGISFYTFHGLSYVIDIYYERIKPTTNYIEYSVFVSYFPLLVAGPIERANHLLPQIEKKREFNYSQAIDGLRQALWGMFKKVVIADNIAQYVDYFFQPAQTHSSFELMLGALFFTIQIYCDFSGYSDIAIGISKLFGIELMQNFKFPYFSRSIRVAWTKWHISLTSWFKDYLYPVLWQPKRNVWILALNTAVIMMVCGLWHGANFTFIAWGLLHALYMVVPILFPALRKKHKMKTGWKDLPFILFTFSLTIFSLVLFRAATLHDALFYYKQMFSQWHAPFPSIVHFKYVFLCFCMFAMEWSQRERNHGLDIQLKSKWLRWLLYFVLLWLIMHNFGNQHDFIYFQF